jgi:hypothetical protein
MARAKKKPFWVMVIVHKEEVHDGVIDYTSELLLKPTMVLATNEEKAKLVIHREVDLEEHDLDDIEVLVAPFL